MTVSGGWQQLGTYVRQERIRRRQTQAEFAQSVGLSPRTIGDIENGRRDDYDADTHTKVELGLGWEPGSVGLVAGGTRPRLAMMNDPAMERLRAVWPELTQRVREALAELAEAISSGGG